MDYPLRFVDQLRPHLRALRKKRGLTQAQAGALVGVSQARIAEIEANPGAVGLEQLTKLLSTLGATFFLREDTPSGGVQNAMEPAATYELLQDTAVNIPAGPWMTRKMSDGSVLATLPPGEPDAPALQSSGDGSAQPQSTAPGALLRQLQALNPGKDVKPTSRRSFVIRPKTGSW
ncbi:HTH-type transcriptional regulator/antitoxin HipB [Variovorax paradoxus]|jgi:HTH-type transcriptional regulator / antitoxin HipB|uniref:helix-turn-helix domain-containing protein n=1 Tax=Variovorax paradoxus TaxID=34073 RepID=UPI0027938FB6|nr:helix-turn-helix domain-containing protein [Variovorax paradoxus]MDQ0573312.1 HTH-type transcriptional regulator/antitoxin HipB [Variovorax paradoxus]